MITYTKDSNSTITTETITIGEAITTIDDTPTLAYSYSTEEISYEVFMKWGAGTTGTLKKYGGELKAAYARDIGLDITKINSDVVTEFSSYDAPHPTIYTVVNVPNQSIDVYVQGTFTDVINWTLKLEILHKTPTV